MEAPRRREILVVIPRLEVGGAERHLLNVLPHLDPARFKVSLLALRPGGALDGRFRAAGVRVIAPPRRMRGWASLAWSAARLVGLMALRRRMRVHYFLPEAYVVGGLCGLLTLHGRQVMSRRSLNVYQQGHPLIARLEGVLHRRMDAVVGNSRAVIENLVEEGVPRDRLRMIYNCVEVAPPQRPRDEVRAALGAAPGDLVIIKVANLYAYKGHADLLAGLAEVRHAMPPWRLILVGRDEGMADQLLEYAAAHGLAERVQVLGMRSDVPDLLAAADMAVLCSHQEGFSNSLLEAMAAGLPAVATRVGGSPEAVVDGETGVLVEPHAPAELGQAILRLASDSDLRTRMGHAARQRAAACFSQAACVGAYEALYDDLDSGGA